MPFRGRGGELRRLADWRADESVNPVLMICGPAGVGKTRLALRFASSLPEQWATGWLRAGTGAMAAGAVRACGDPAMILVDDADGRADLAQFLGVLAEGYTSPVTRVILLARSAAGLAASLASQLDDRHEWIVSRAPVVELEPEGGPEDRERWFEEAVAAFAAKQEAAVPALSPAGRMDADEPMLVLQAQALLAVLGTANDTQDPRKRSFGQVAEALMKHEKRRWAAVAAAWNWGAGGLLSDALQESTITALVLLGFDSGGEAEQILRRIPELRDATAERLATVTDFISAFYPPGPDGAPRIRPGMIGEWFVVSQLTARPALAEALRDGLTDDQAARALSFLASAADRMKPAGRLFGEFATGSQRRRILAAAHAAMTGHAGRQLLDAVIAEQIRGSDEWTIDQLADIDSMIPAHVLLLTHVAIADCTVRLWRAEARDSSAGHQACLARAVRNLSVRLERVGRYREALAAYEEAVALYRALALDDPAVHRPGLAGAVDNLGAGLERVGRYREALAAYEEAVALYRALVRDDPAVHQPGLGLALDNLGAGLERVGRYREALAAYEEAVALYRALALDDPAVHQPELALAVRGLGIGLDRVGRYREALAAFEEAVALYRALVRDDPAVHQPGLGLALDNLGAGLERVGRLREALVANEEAVALYRALVRDDPAVHRPELAWAVRNLGTGLERVGRYREALAAYEEAVALYRALAREDPAIYQPELARAVDNLGVGLEKVGRDQEALAAYEEAVALYRALAREDPAVHQPGLARAVRNLGIGLHRVGRYGEGLAANEEAVALYRSPARDNPAVHQPELATALDNLGAGLDRAGRSREALSARTEATDIFRQLASRDPDLYQKEYQQKLGALRREYDQRGLHDEAVLLHLTDPATQPPPAAQPLAIPQSAAATVTSAVFVNLRPSARARLPTLVTATSPDNRSRRWHAAKGRRIKATLLPTAPFTAVLSTHASKPLARPATASSLDAS